MDKHLLAENPMSGNGNLAIVRTVQPIAIFEAINVEENNGHVHIGGKIYKTYYYTNSDGMIEQWVLKVHHYFSTDIDTIEEKEVYKFMDDAWHWYKAYMKWEDENIDKNFE